MLKFVLLLSLLCIHQGAFSQHLDKISPVFLTEGTLPDTVSFILTATDYNTFQGKKVQYPSSLQIVDGALPWPPRWFATAPFETGGDVADSLAEPIAKPLINASWQDDKMTVLSLVRVKDSQGKVIIREAELICNKQLEFTDTFVRTGKSIDTHDFRMKPDGQKIYFAMHDTVIDMRTVFNNQTDSAVALSYQTIEISDAGNKIIFSWNPLYHFSLNEMFLPYRYTPGTMHTGTALDWSHGSSLCWDEDGNILYSFKHIGIGKISRKDGHVMWRISRNLQKPNEASDAIPIFMQHDFKSFTQTNGQVIYTVLSNGDSSRPYTTAYQFKVMGEEKNPVFKIVRRFEPDVSVPNTGAGGNYDVEENGNYLINYGAFEGDSSTKRLLFEYRDRTDKIIAQYKVPSRIICYRVHKMNNNLLPRPLIKIKNRCLYAGNGLKAHTWYRLSGPGNTIATEVGEGEKYQPTEKGVYCMTEPYGVGYAVSVPVVFDK